METGAFPFIIKGRTMVPEQPKPEGAQTAPDTETVMPAHPVAVQILHGMTFSAVIMTAFVLFQVIVENTLA